MPKAKSQEDRTRRDPAKPQIERTGARSSPGSGEADDDEAADLQPNEVENESPAR